MESSIEIHAVGEQGAVEGMPALWPVQRDVQAAPSPEAGAARRARSPRPNARGQSPDHPRAGRVLATFERACQVRAQGFGPFG